jgi:hypothetical protein
MDLQLLSTCLNSAWHMEAACARNSFPHWNGELDLAHYDTMYPLNRPNVLFWKPCVGGYNLFSNADPISQNDIFASPNY